VAVGEKLAPRVQGGQEGQGEGKWGNGRGDGGEKGHNEAEGQWGGAGYEQLSAANFLLRRGYVELVPPQQEKFFEKNRSEERWKRGQNVERTTINHTEPLNGSRRRSTGVEEDGNGSRRDGGQGGRRLVGKLRMLEGGGDSSKTIKKLIVLIVVI